MIDSSIWHPKITLHDRINGKVKPGAKTGPPSYLSAEDGDELVSFLKWLLINYWLCQIKKQIIALV